MNRLVIIGLGFFLSILLSGCHRKESVLAAVEIVKYDPSSNEDFISSGIIRGIELIPLESGDGLFVSADSGPIIAGNNDYYIVDPARGKILRFDSQGRFLNTIGARGRGPNEYTEISNVQYFPDKKILSVYSSTNDAIINYSNTGEYISHDKVYFDSQQVIRHDDDYWHYLGFPNEVMAERVIQTGPNREDVISKYLPTNAKIISMLENTPSLIEYDDNIYVRESLNNNIYRIDKKGNMYAEYCFDFSRYNIPDQYFNMDDSREAMEMLLSTSFATIYNFFINDRYIITEIMIQTAPESQDDMILAFAIKDKQSGKWTWLNYNPIKNSDNLFVTHFGTLTENSELIFLADPYKLINSNITESELINNPEVIDNITEESNCVIVKCHLKTQ